MWGSVGWQANEKTGEEEKNQNKMLDWETPRKGGCFRFSFIMSVTVKKKKDKQKCH